MIFRLTHKLKARIKAGNLASLPLHENPLADWSSGLIVVHRRPYILLCNTKSLYSFVLPGRGITDASDFIKHALGAIHAALETEGKEAAFQRFIAPAAASVRFARALNRSVTGSLNDLSRLATYDLETGDRSLAEIGTWLARVPMSALVREGFSHGFPRNVFFAMLESAGRARPSSNA